jgi:hypothetical protein
MLYKALKGCTVTPDDNLQAAAVQQFREKPKEFFVESMHKLQHQWDSCLNACRNFSKLLQYLHLHLPQIWHGQIDSCNIKYKTLTHN